MKDFLLNMECNKVHKWNEHFDFPLTIEHIRTNINERKEFFRLTSSTYPSTSEKSIMKERKIENYHFETRISNGANSYIFMESGECRIQIGAKDWFHGREEFLLKQGDFFKFDLEGYIFEVDTPCTKISLFLFVEIPKVLEAVRKQYNL